MEQKTIQFPNLLFVIQVTIQLTDHSVIKQLWAIQLPDMSDNRMPTVHVDDLNKTDYGIVIVNSNHLNTNGRPSHMTPFEYRTPLLSGITMNPVMVNTYLGLHTYL